jgi:hypothetical protein
MYRSSFPFHDLKIGGLERRRWRQQAEQGKESGANQDKPGL